MDVSIDLLINALVAGFLLGGFYAAVTIGVSISFGMLDIVNIAHPASIILGSYIAYLLNTRYGIDPILASVRLEPWPQAPGPHPSRRPATAGLLRMRGIVVACQDQSR